jgi:hypothetical protein
MKRIIIISIIAVCLLSFTGISSLAKEHPTYEEVWNNICMSDMYKTLFVKGIAGGFELSVVITGHRNTELSDEFVDWSNFIVENGETIIKVMDSLYKDPANAYIGCALICFVACRKLKGEDTEQLLKDLRKIGYQEYQRRIEK